MKSKLSLAQFIQKAQPTSCCILDMEHNQRSQTEEAIGFSRMVSSLLRMFLKFSRHLMHSSLKFTNLVMVIDACYSGCWVERLKQSKFENYRVIQASTQSNQGLCIPNLEVLSFAIG